MQRRVGFKHLPGGRAGGDQGAHFVAGQADILQQMIISAAQQTVDGLTQSVALAQIGKDGMEHGGLLQVRIVSDKSVLPESLT